MVMIAVVFFRADRDRNDDFPRIGMSQRGIGDVCRRVRFSYFAPCRCFCHPPKGWSETEAGLLSHIWNRIDCIVATTAQADLTVLFADVVSKKTDDYTSCHGDGQRHTSFNKSQPAKVHKGGKSAYHTEIAPDVIKILARAIT